MYSSEKNVQILISLMKKNNIKKVIISPGSANLSFVGSIQCDSFFELYSCVDERSAAYMACGMSEECGEPVAISCTGATASRNYLPALTEAYYRKLPILAITSTRRLSMIAQNVDQVIDRTQIQNDVAKISVTLPVVVDENTEWECNLKVNEALLELNHRGKGPVHINLVTSYSTDFHANRLPDTRLIQRFTTCDNATIPSGKKVAVFVGSHSCFHPELTDAVDEFCDKYDGFVICDQTSNYKGKFGIYLGLLNLEENSELSKLECDILIHIGNVSAIWPPISKEIWRVNPDGIIRDTYKKLTKVFEMDEVSFFSGMSEKRNISCVKTYKLAKAIYEKSYLRLSKEVENLPFSSLWIALKSHRLLPSESVIHFGILNSLRCWSCFELEKSIRSYSNVGGFGIDGGVSSLIGAAISNPKRLFFGVFGDLAFFYDMNSLGNRHIKNNVRIMIINNGLGVEFKRSDINVQKAGLGDLANSFISAEGHYGRKSKTLVKNYAESLSFLYMSSTTKEEFERLTGDFFSKTSDRPIVFEVFVDEHDDSNSLSFLKSLAKGENTHNNTMDRTKQIAKSFLGEKGISAIKKMINK